MNQLFYEKIAKEFGVTAEDVKIEMQKAINAAYDDPNEEAERIPRRDEVPNIEEFVDYIVSKIAK